MTRQGQSEAPRDYGCLSHAVGGSAARQRGEVVRDDNDQTGRLGYQDAEETRTPRGGSRDDDGEVTVGHVDSGLPQAKPGGSIQGRERGQGGDKCQGVHGAGVPYNPLATIQAGVARVEGRPGDRPYGDGGEGLTGSDDSPAPTKNSHGDCWQWQRCSPGRSTPEQATSAILGGLTISSTWSDETLSPGDSYDCPKVDVGGGGSSRNQGSGSPGATETITTLGIPPRPGGPGLRGSGLLPFRRMLRRREWGSALGSPLFPAKQADRVMESTVTTVRGSLGLAPLDPGPVATAAGKGGGAAAAGAQQSWVRR